MKKRLLAVVLTLCMVLTMTPMVAFADEHHDVDGHWAEDLIIKWSKEGVIQGHNGAFNPNGPMTRAEAAQVVVNLCGLDGTADLSQYTDMKASDWHAPAIAACVAAGIFNGTSDTEMSPNAALSREMLFVMIGRAIGIEPATKLNVPFPDSNEVSPYARGIVYALANAGYIKGMGGEIEPGIDINRASVIALLDQTIVARVTTNGTVEATEDGIILVLADNVTITGDADVTIAVVNEGTTVSLEGATGDITVIANADDVKVADAPEGTTIAVADGVTGTTANGQNVAEGNEVVIKEEVPAASGGSGGGGSRPSGGLSDVQQPTQQPTDTPTGGGTTTPTQPTTGDGTTTPTQPTSGKTDTDVPEV